MTLPRSDLGARRDLLDLLRHLRHRALAPTLAFTGRSPSALDAHDVELRLRVDEQVLLPALDAADAAIRPSARAVVEEIALCRSLLDALRSRRSSIAVQRALSITTVRLLREQWRSVERLANQAAMVEVLDWVGMLEHGRAVIKPPAAPGREENENADPVGSGSH